MKNIVLALMVVAGLAGCNKSQLDMAGKTLLPQTADMAIVDAQPDKSLSLDGPTLPLVRDGSVTR